MFFKKIAVFIVLAIPFSAFGNDNEHLVSDLLNSTVKIVSYSDNDKAASGSGVIVSEQGLILTNYHVIHRTKRVKLWLYQNRNGHFYEAVVLAIDPAADLALLYVNFRPTDYFHVSTFEHEEGVVFAGEDVIAVGHPLGLDWTVSRGTINSVNRPSFITPYINLIQHDATINQGSSGGPLFNENGNLIGINTYIVAPDSQGVAVYSGFGYAVQGDDVETSLIRMAQTGGVDGLRPAFKMNIVNLNEEVSNYIQTNSPGIYIPDTFGIIVAQLDENDYGYAQGLRLNDVIVSIDGFPVNNMVELSAFLKNNKYPGDTVYLLVNRERKFILIPYVLAEMDVSIEMYDEEARTLPEKLPEPEEENNVDPR